MIWVTACAVYLTVARQVLIIHGGANDFAAQLTEAIKGLASGTALTAVVMLWMRRPIRVVFAEPGFWLLLATLPSTLAHSPIEILTTFFPSYSSPGTMPGTVVGSFFLFAAIVFCVAIRIVHELRWRISFIGLAIVFAIQALFEFALAYLFSEVGVPNALLNLWNIAGVGTFLAYMAVGIISIAEVVSHVRHDWIHWAGVIVFLAPLAAAFVV